jgi:hypothetical protein
MNVVTFLLIQWGSFLERLRGAQLGKEFTNFYGTGKISNRTVQQKSDKYTT